MYLKKKKELNLLVKNQEYVCLKQQALAVFDLLLFDLL